MEVSNKVQMYDLLGKGAFGNTLPLWANMEAKTYTGLAGVRSIGRPGLPCVTGLPGKVIVEIGRKICQDHFCEVAYYPHPEVDGILLQGEVTRNQYGLWLEYTTVKAPMRPALREMRKVAKGLSAMEILRSQMTSSSWADTEALLDMYPGAVVELGIYQECLGTIPGRNTLIWEVRHY